MPVSESDIPSRPPARRLRVLLCSSDPFGQPTLTALYQRGWLAGLITQPDRPRGRGQVREPLPLKQNALHWGIPVLTPAKIGSPEAVAALRLLEPEYVVIAAYAQYLPKAVRGVPRQACLNIHPSPLPQYRGPAPIVASLWEGAHQTAVAIHYTERGIDTGDVLAMEPVAIAPDWNHGTLREHLAEVGARLLVQTLFGLESGSLTPVAQEHAQATLTRLLTPADRQLPLATCTATELANRVRALSPEPGALLQIAGEPLIVLAATVPEGPPQPAGTLWQPSARRLAVATADGWLELLQVIPPGRKAMEVNAWLNGLRSPLPDHADLLTGDPRPLVSAVPQEAAHG